MEASYHKGSSMAISLNHTIVFAQDKHVSAFFLTSLFGLPDPVPAGPFLAVQLENGVTLDFADPPIDVLPQHYAFLVSEEDFDRIYGLIVERGWSTGPIRTSPGRARSTGTTVAAASTSTTRQDTTSRSSPARTVPAARRSGAARVGGRTTPRSVRCLVMDRRRCEFRFYGELDEFLAPAQRKRSFEHAFDGTPSVRTGSNHSASRTPRSI